MTLLGLALGYRQSAIARDESVGERRFLVASIDATKRLKLQKPLHKTYTNLPIFGKVCCLLPASLWRCRHSTSPQANTT